LTLGLGACTTLPTPSASPFIPLVHVDNQADVPVTVLVNGTAVAVVPPSSLADPVNASFPDRPWTVELQLANGRSLARLQVPGGNITVGYFVRGRTQCGVVDLTVADPLPGGGPAFSRDPSDAPCR
jgi:hypothetical protein